MSKTMDKLAKELKAQMNASDARKPKPYDAQAEVLRVEDGVAWVHIPGGVEETPVRLTINAKKGDMVNIRVANGSAWITGNGTNPPTDDSTANYAVDITNSLNKDVVVLNTVVAENIEATNARFGYVEADTAKIHDLTADQLTASVGYISDLTADHITAGDISAASGYIKDLTADHITAGDISAASGYIQDLTSEHITTEDISAATGYIGDLTSKSITTDDLSAATGFIGDLTAGDITAQNVIADHATVGSLDANYAKIADLNAAKGRIDDLEANEVVVNDTLKAANANIDYLKSDWISTDRLVLTGNNKNNYPPVEITEAEFNVNKTAYWTKSGDTYIQCTTSSIYNPDAQYYVRQNVKSIIEAINTANSTDPQVVVSNDKLIAASMDVAELSAITADMGELTAGKIKKGNNFINLDTSPASMEFKNASTWANATQGLQFDTQGNLNIKGKVTITSGSNVPTTDEMNSAIDDIDIGGRNLFGYWSQCETLNGITVIGDWNIVTEDGYKCAHVSGAFNKTNCIQSKIPYLPAPNETITFSGFVKIKNIVDGTTNPMCEFYFGGETIDGRWMAPDINAIYLDGRKVQLSNPVNRFPTYISDTKWHHFAIVKIWPNCNFTANQSPLVYLRDCTGDLYVRHIKYERGNKATDWSPAPEDVQADIDRIEIGGRNLAGGTASVAKGSGDWSTGTWRNSSGNNTFGYTVSDSPVAGVDKGILITATSASPSEFGIAQDNCPLVSRKLTYSVWVKGAAGGTVRLQSVWWSGISVSDFVKSFTTNGEWQRLVVNTDLTNTTIPTGKCSICYMYFAGAKANDTCIFLAPKLEYGSKATDWTPAPEDIKSTHNLVSSYSQPYSTIASWAAEGSDAGNWTVSSTVGVKKGDTVRIKCSVSDMNNAAVYVVGTVTSVDSSTALHMTSHGLDTTVIDGGNILTNSIGANQIQSNSIGAKHLTISDSTNLAIANEMYESSLPSDLSATFLPAISGGYLVKKVATQEYLMLTDYTANSLKQNDELYYEFYGKASTAGTVSLNVWGYTGTPPTHNYSHGEGLDIALTTTEQFFSGTLKLTNAKWSTTATQYLIGFFDTRSTKSQIHIRKCIIRRKSAGELIVDGSITANKLTIGSINSGGVNLLRGSAVMYPHTGTYASATFRKSGDGVIQSMTTTFPREDIIRGLRLNNNTSAAATVGCCQDYLPLKIKAGQNVTMSAWMKGSANNLVVEFQSLWIGSVGHICNQMPAADKFKVTTSWKRYIYTFTAITDFDGTPSAAYIYATSLPAGAYVDVCGIKLEMGNVASEWSDDTDFGGTNIFGPGSDCTSSISRLGQSENKFSIVEKDGQKCAKIEGVKGKTGYLCSPSSHYITFQSGTFYTISADIRLDNYSAGTTNPYISLYFGGGTNNPSGSWKSVSYLESSINGKRGPAFFDRLSEVNNKGWVHVVQPGFEDTTFTSSLCPAYIYARDFTGQLYVRNIKLEIGYKGTAWSPTPETGMIDDAATKATNYISADSSGIRIASANPATQNQRLQLTNSQAIFYSSDNKARLSLDSSAGVVIGRSDTGHTAINDSNFLVYNSSNTEVAKLGSELRIGTSTGAHATVTTNGLEIYNASNQLRASLGANWLCLGDPASTRVTIGTTSADPYIYMNQNGHACFRADPNGIHFYDNNDKRRSTTNVNGLSIYDTDGTTSVATFGATARIGKASTQRTEIKSDGVYIYNQSNAQYGYFGTFTRIGDYNGKNVRIDGDGIKFNSTTDTQVALFSPTSIELGKNSISSVVKLCGGTGKIHAFTNSSNQQHVNISSTGANSTLSLWAGNGGSSMDFFDQGILRLDTRGSNSNWISGIYMDSTSADPTIELTCQYVQLQGDADSDTGSLWYMGVPPAGSQAYNAIWHKSSNDNYGLYRPPSSSRRYKEDIKPVEDDRLDPHRLYDIPVMQFKFKEGYFLQDDPYELDRKDVIGFIAEDVLEHYPQAAIMIDEEVENWDERYIIPPMLKLIQEQNDRITELERRLS